MCLGILHGLLHTSIAAKAMLHQFRSISFRVRSECLNTVGEAFPVFSNSNVFVYPTTTGFSLQ